MRIFNKYFKFTFASVLLTSVIFFSGSYNSAETSSQQNNLVLADTFTLPANPGPANNGGSAGWAMFLDLIAGPRSVDVTQMSTASTAPANTTYTITFWTRQGTSLGGPGGSSTGWTQIGTANVTQGATSSGISLVFNIPTISIAPHDTVGVAMVFNSVGPRYYGTGSPPLSNYSDTNLTLITGEARSTPFQSGGSIFSSRALCGVVRYVMGTPVGISKNESRIPETFILSQNYPNPFNPITTIEFGLSEKSNVTLKVYNEFGQEAATLVSGVYSAGTYSVSWDASDFSSGVYFCRMNAGNFTETKRMILLK